MKYRIIAVIAAVFLIAMSGFGAADVLPKPVPENQVFTTTSIMEGVGATQEKTTVAWQIGDAGLTNMPRSWLDSNNNVRAASIAYVTYSDFITTNGGQISEVKSFSMDTHSKTAGLYNIETSKVLTYTSQNGSHLMGEESYVLDVAGNWRDGLDDIVCVFAKNNKSLIPAFCNKVTASSKLTSITTAQVETIGALTAVSSKGDTPAALKYEISVTPDANSASGYADGIVSTTFTVSVMEGRTDGWYDKNFGASAEVLEVLTGLTSVQATAAAIDVDCTDIGGGQAAANSTECITYALGLTGNDAIPADALANLVWDDSAFAPNNEFMSWTSTKNVDQDCPTWADCSATLAVPPADGIWAAGAAWTVVTPGVEGQDAVEGDLEYDGTFEELASRLTYIDTATVAGGISTFNKAFNYQSGTNCEFCSF